VKQDFEPVRAFFLPKVEGCDSPTLIVSKDESSEHPVEVVLRFTLRVADRVASTTWHESHELKAPA